MSRQLFLLILPFGKFFFESENFQRAKWGVWKVPEAGYAPKNTFATPSPRSVLDISGMLYLKSKVIFESLSGNTLLTLTLKKSKFPPRSQLLIAFIW